ncbi:sodium-dependent neutral amino acid transporter B(0)AT3 isoform X4 [Maniola jurtina]|uniref:sodium-dependent neutral amino acid transporter B(0)AT3 isoform X4 n=1 Tax=Maniola jurtina TaxID=191418 RepID=UPI001E68A69E|nr:sodium-dependent neutral amino acid transporter B(0)AT3 isoform X4 [Maniola jurtina]
MAAKAEPIGPLNGHELAPLNTRADGSERPHGVTIVLQGSRSNSLQRDVPGDDRAAWSGKLQFFLSIIGYSVGLGNIWRFPYLCQQNGGGAFLIPFLIMLILEGIPLFLIEMAIGQKMRLGSLGVWNTIHPWLGGIGIASCVVTLFVALYYNVIITWVFFYLFNSIRLSADQLPWAHCPQDNSTAEAECTKASATVYYWYREALDASPSIEEPGTPRWWIVLYLLLAWIIVFFIVMKGIQSSGKVVYFTSLFPYVVLTIFFVRGITLPGSADGIIHMYKPKLAKLLDPTVWLDAATQVFYSFGLAFGSLIAFGSYNPPNNNCVRDVLLVSVCNALTAIYASVVIFSILGFKAYTMVEKCIVKEIKILAHNNISGFEWNSTQEYYEEHFATLNSSDVARLNLTGCSMSKNLEEAAEGTGLAFIVFTQAILKLTPAPFWSIIFFLMLLSLGLGSQIGIMEGMLCTIFDIDFFKRFSKPVITGAVCTFCFFVGLIFTTGAGEYWLKMFDSFAGTIGLVVVALLEMVSVVYIYGHEKFSNDIYEMTGYRPGWYWQVTWRYVGPFIVSCILLSSLIFMILYPPTYGAWNAAEGRVEKTPYPDWVLGIAVAMILAGILPIPVVLLLRRFQCLALDVDIHQGSIRRIETTVSTKEMMSDQDVLSPESAPPAQLLPDAAAKFTIGDFDSDSEPSQPRTAVHYEDSSSSDDEILNAKYSTGTGIRLSMKPIGHNPNTFKMDVVD